MQHPNLVELTLYNSDCQQNLDEDYFVDNEPMSHDMRILPSLQKLRIAKREGSSLLPRLLEYLIGRSVLLTEVTLDISYEDDSNVLCDALSKCMLLFKDWPNLTTLNLYIGPLTSLTSNPNDVHQLRQRLSELNIKTLIYMDSNDTFPYLMRNLPGDLRSLRLIRGPSNNGVFLRSFTSGLELEYRTGRPDLPHIDLSFHDFSVGEEARKHVDRCLELFRPGSRTSWVSSTHDGRMQWRTPFER